MLFIIIIISIAITITIFVAPATSIITKMTNEGIHLFSDEGAKWTESPIVMFEPKFNTTPGNVLLPGNFSLRLVVSVNIKVGNLY